MSRRGRPRDRASMATAEASLGLKPADAVEQPAAPPLLLASLQHFSPLQLLSQGADAAVLLVVTKTSLLGDTGRRYTLKLTPCGEDGASAASAQPLPRIRWDAPELMVSQRVPPHPNICRVWTVFEDVLPDALREFLTRDGGALLLQALQSSQWAACCTLRDYHPSVARVAYAPGAARDFVTIYRHALDLSRGVAHLRAHGVAHRDIHPDNILLAVDGRAVLADAGMAVVCKDADSMAMPYVQGAPVAGALAYTAPEVLICAQAASGGSGEKAVIPYDKADVWSMGVTLLALILGEHPWPAYPYAATAAESAVLCEPPSRMKLPVGTELPKHFLDLLTWAVWPHTHPRITARALVARLEALATGSPPPSLLITAVPWPWAVTPAGVVAATLGINVRDAAGHIVTVHVRSDTLPRVLFAHVALAAAEMLPISHPPGEYSLLHAGLKIDPDAPVSALMYVFEASALILAHGLATVPPTVMAPGIGYAIQFIKLKELYGFIPASGDNEVAGASAAGSPPAPYTSGLTASTSSSAPTAAATTPTPALSALGDSVAAVSVSPDRVPMFAFSPVARGTHVTLSEGGTVATCADKWSTVFLNHTGLTAERAGKYLFSVRLLMCESGTGAAIGVADAMTFDPTLHNLGAQPGSWAYSKTGKISSGRGKWEEYGEAFSTGDIITVEVECREGRIKFYRNGVSQGVAFVEPELRSATLKPAVCLGGTVTGRSVRVQLLTPEVREFDRSKAHHRIQFSEDCTTVFNSGKWASALAAHPGMTHGRSVWTIRLDDTKHGAGVAVGVVCADKFDWEKQNLGASPNSWCFSKTGKKGDGSGFKDYGKAFTFQDTITVTLDMDACTLSFAVNGEDQGVAYDSTAGIGSCPLVPAVCLGSTEGGKMAKVSLIGLPSHAYPRRFDRFACSSKVRLTDSASRAETTDKWGTVFVEHPGVSVGKSSFAIQVTSAGQGCGAGIGFADMRHFKPHSRNLGAAEYSWCYSKTGKKSGGSAAPQFEMYGAPYKTGDTITAEVDMDAETIRFLLNGHDQGVAFSGGLRGRTLVPAVVLGSSDGGHYTQLTIAPPAVTRLDIRRCNRTIAFSNSDRTAQTDARWCSCFADHPGVSSGVVRFAVKLEGEGGAAVGFGEASMFKPHAQNLGASLGTWALSKTGKVSAGDAEGFKAFSDKLVAGDVIGIEADMTNGVIRFWRNGMYLGVAFTGLAGRGYTLVPAICIGSNGGGKLALVTLVEFEAAWAPSPWAPPVA